MMNANFVLEMIEKIIETATKMSEQNTTLGKWYAMTADTARQIEHDISNSITEFENVALALSALKTDIPIITVDVLVEVEGFDESLNAYDTSDDTPYGALINASKDALKSIGLKIQAAIKDITVLYKAVGVEDLEKIEKIREEFLMTTPPLIVNEKTHLAINEPEEESEEVEDVEPEEEQSVEAPESVTVKPVNDPVVQKMVGNVDITSAVDITPGQMMFGYNPSELGLTDEEAAGLTEKREITEPEAPKSTPTVFEPFRHKDKTDKTTTTPTTPTTTTTTTAAVEYPEESRHRNPMKCNGAFIELKIPGFNPDHFMIRNDMSVIVDRYTGRKINPFTKHGLVYVTFRKYGGQNESIDILFDSIIMSPEGWYTADPEPKTKNGGSGSIVYKSDGTKTSSAKKKSQPPIDDEFVYVDWIDGLPKSKYKVFRSGKIYDTVNECFVRESTGSRKQVRLSAGDVYSKTEGVESAQFSFTRQSLVVRAFYPNLRERHRVFVDFIDGDSKNCAIDNLRVRSR